jgi:hypothetical protein
VVLDAPAMLRRRHQLGHPLQHASRQPRCALRRRARSGAPAPAQAGAAAGDGMRLPARTSARKIDSAMEFSATQGSHLPPFTRLVLGTVLAKSRRPMMCFITSIDRRRS